MSATEGFFVLDLENRVVGDKGKVEGTTKGSSGGGARQKLGNISNLPQRPKPSTQDEKSQIITTSKEYVDQLQKENMALMKLLADRNKIIELSGFELQKLRVNLQKVQQQNWQLAQANSQMLAELNSGKDRLKVLHHELGCKNSLLKAKKIELEEKAKTRTCQKIGSEVEMTRCEEESSQAVGEYNKPCNTNRKQRSKSLGPSTTKQVQVNEKSENKRLCLRRQSARFKCEEPERTEDLFELDNAEFPICSLGDDKMQEDGSASMSSSVKKEDTEGNTAPRDEAREFRRSSIGRPSRLAVKKVNSYKEVPLNVKMRRLE
ncbi:SHUGOSHIN 2-like [Cornus florida]|uniref:SHUGOSHIN 2-like n=1 Tax=Cornus florida TaxID=4283 RepID=UPI0028A06B0C|nr:SHUGOSHIN 2-like [Cornus florida]